MTTPPRRLPIVPSTVEEANAVKLAASGYGFWCFDCDAPMLAGTYGMACANAFTAGWKRIRGVDRCPTCAALDEARNGAWVLERGDG